MRRSFLLLIALSSIGSAATAQNIGIFFDSRGAPTCTGQAVPGHVTAMYIMAWLGGGASAGITGAEFRVSGMPPEWLTTTVPNSASNIVLGDPFNGVGVNQAFPTCQTAPIIILFTVNVMPTSSVSDLYLRVEPRNPPLNPNFACPLVTNCEFPGFAIVCTTGGQGIVNPTGALCTVTTTPASWSSVKALYDEP